MKKVIFGAAALLLCGSMAFAQSTDERKEAQNSHDKSDKIEKPTVDPKDVPGTPDDFDFEKPRNNHSKIKQIGENNTASVTQLGWKSISLIHQFGNDNTATVNQDETSDFNRAEVVQKGVDGDGFGTGNTATVNQSGFFNNALIQQLGDNNTATSTQNNSEFDIDRQNISRQFQQSDLEGGNVATVNQDGFSLEATQYQWGDNNTASSSQFNRAQTSVQVQEGNGNTANSTQDGGTDLGTEGNPGFNVVKQAQFGDNNTAGAVQSGARLSSTQIQYGEEEGNVAQVDQIGGSGFRNWAQQTQGTGDDATTGNDAGITQTNGFRNAAYQNQTGDNNLARASQDEGSSLIAVQDQSGNENAAFIEQTGDGNRAFQIQSANTSEVLATQSGEDNLSVQLQSGSFEFGIVNQSGQSNRALQDQRGEYNLAFLSQSGEGNLSIQNQFGVGFDGANFNNVSVVNQINAFGAEGHVSVTTQLLGEANSISVNQGVTANGLGNFSDVFQAGARNAAIVNQNPGGSN